MRKVPAGNAELLRSQHTLKAEIPALCWMQSTVRGGRSLVPTKKMQGHGVRRQSLISLQSSRRYKQDKHHSLCHRRILTQTIYHSVGGHPFLLSFPWLLQECPADPP